MIPRALVSTAELAGHLADPNWAIVDCRFDLSDPMLGERNYTDGHVPGAVYAHIDHDLSSPIQPGVTGRHPLPDVGTFADRLGAWGIDESVTVVVYDDLGGAYAARLWWMLRWLGHDATAVLDGGWTSWTHEARPTAAGLEAREPGTFVAVPRPNLVADAGDVARALADPGSVVVDARAADRFRGENETVDPVAGHIRGAISAPYTDNLGADGLFEAADELRARYSRLLGDVPADRAIVYCGSGVTAAHDLVAMHHAGLGEARLYVGSWSEWITDPTRAVATGAG